MTVRLTREERAEAFAFLEKSLGSDELLKTGYEKILNGFHERQDSYTWLACRKNGSIIGLLLAEEEFRIVFLYIDAKERRKGTATELVSELEKEADHCGISRIRIQALGDSIAFFEHAGFDVLNRYEGTPATADMEYLCGKYLLGKTVTVLVDRPYGSLDLRAEGQTTVNCGYIEEAVTMEDCEIKEACIVGVHMPAEKFTGVVIALVYHEEDSHIHAVVARKGAVIDHDEVIQEIGMVEQYYHSRIVFADEMN